VNIKKIINTIKNQGPKAFKCKDDEIIQVVTNGHLYCVVNQEFLLELLSIKENSTPQLAKATSSPHDMIKFRKKLEKKMKTVRKLIAEDREEFSKKIKKAQL
jgi:hypothetical protein